MWRSDWRRRNLKISFSGQTRQLCDRPSAIQLQNTWECRHPHDTKKRVWILTSDSYFCSEMSTTLPFASLSLQEAECESCVSSSWPGAAAAAAGPAQLSVSCPPCAACQRTVFQQRPLNVSGTCKSINGGEVAFWCTVTGLQTTVMKYYANLQRTLSCYVVYICANVQLVFHDRGQREIMSTRLCKSDTES